MCYIFSAVAELWLLVFTRSCQLLRLNFEKTLIEVSFPVFRLFYINPITYTRLCGSSWLAAFLPARASEQGVMYTRVCPCIICINVIKKNCN